MAQVVDSDAGQREELAQGPAHPEVLFHAHGLQTHRFIDLLEGEVAAGGGDLKKGVHRLLWWLGQLTEDVGDPRRSMDEIFANGGVIRVGDATVQDGDDLIIDLLLPEMAEGLNDGSADSPGSGHISRSGVLEDDFSFADFDFAGRAVGQENDAGRNLIRKSENVGRIGP